MGGVARRADFIGRGQCLNPTCVQDRRQLPKTISKRPGLPVEQHTGEFNSEMAEDSFGKMNGAPDADIAIFTEALRLPPEERNRYLDEACKADVEFRRRVEALLQAYEQAGDFLGRSAADRPP